MSLSHFDKEIIKRESKNLSFEELSARINKPKEEVSFYLQKKWKKEKYDKYISKDKPVNKPNEEEDTKLSLWNFVKANLYIYLLFAALIFFTYFNALNNEFVSDDKYVFLYDSAFKSFDTVIKNPTSFVRYLISFLSYSIGGMSPIYYRIPFIISHILATSFAFTIITKLINKRVALISACIFAVHPILAESITWISGGGYSLYSMLFLGSLLFYMQSENSNKSYITSIIFYILMLSSIVTGSVTFLILVLYEYIFKDLRKNYRRLVPYFIVSFLWGLFALGLSQQRASGLQNQYYQERGIDNPLFQIPMAITNYIQLMIWPDGLTLYHSEIVIPISEYIVRLICFIAMCFGVYYLHKKNKKYTFWPLLFVIALSPTLLPFRLSWLIAERYVYLGSLGIFTLFGIFFSYLTDKYENVRKYALLLLGTIVILYGARTIIRNEDWKNEDNLWVATGKTSPSSPNTHNNLGDVYSRHGKYDLALAEFRRAIEIKPNYADAYHNLANVYVKLGDRKSALENYLIAIKYNPNIWQSHTNVSMIYMDEKNYELAEKYLENAAKINPSKDIILFLGQIYLIREKKAEASKMFTTILQSDPNNQVAKEGYLKSIE